MIRAISLLFNFAFLSLITLWAQTPDRLNTPKHNSDTYYTEDYSAIDTISLKYFPLAVGNVYKYYYGFSSGNNYYFKVRVVKDTIINSKKYFITSQALPGYGYSGGLFRVDSTTGNILQRVNTGYCTNTPFELFRDSLRASLGDSTFMCPQNIIKHYCYDTSYFTLFGYAVKVKRFSSYYSGVWTTATYGMNFGIISYTYQSSEGMSAQSLVGCYVNGILYGDTILTGVENISSEVPAGYSLSQNYPNPFNPETKIRFTVPLRRGVGGWNNDGVCIVRLTVYDALGREVETLVNDVNQPGTYEVTFNARRGGSSSLNSGVYFYRLVTDGFSETKRMVLVK